MWSGCIVDKSLRCFSRYPVIRDDAGHAARPMPTRDLHACLYKEREMWPDPATTCSRISPTLVASCALSSLRLQHCAPRASHLRRISWVNSLLRCTVGVVSPVDCVSAATVARAIYRGRDAHCWSAPAQIPAGAIRAPGSHLGRRSQKDWTSGTAWRGLRQPTCPFRASFIPGQPTLCVKHPRWEPGARIAPAGICAGGAQQ